MLKPKILVTGATGKTGAALVSRLRERDWPVRAVVRAEDGRADRLRKLGAEVAVADLFDANQLLQAMRGTQRAYFCPLFHPHMLQSAAAFATAARETKLEAIVGLGQWLTSPNHPSLHTRQLWLVEQMLSSIPGVAFVNLSPGYFADNYLRFIDFASLLHFYPILTGESLNAPPSNDDIARVADALLMDPDRHAGKRYRPTGPKLLSAYDMARTISKVLGQSLSAVNMPFWMFARAARLQGVAPFELLWFRYYIEDHKQGAFAFGAPTDTVEELTGRPAEDFETTTRRYAAMPFAQRTLANRFRAFANFVRVPFTRGYGLDRHEFEHFHPVPPNPLYAMEDNQWRANRKPQSKREVESTSAVMGAKP